MASQQGHYWERFMKRYDDSDSTLASDLARYGVRYILMQYHQYLTDEGFKPAD